MKRIRKKRSGQDFINGNKVRLVRGGSEYFQLILQLIDGATDTIHLQTYIYYEDETGKAVAAALVRAAKRNVKVYLLVDGYASRSLTTEFISQLTAAGVNFRFFEPLFKSDRFYFGRRLHHKVLVIDNCKTMVGGINISDNYNDFPGKPAWLDFAVLAEGAICTDLCLLCCKTWKGYTTGAYVTPCNRSGSGPTLEENENSLIRMRRNDWVHSKNQISRTYIEMLSRADDHIFILCSYFLPGTLIRKTIKKAIERGVKVKVIVAGKSDLLIAKNAERYMYDWLLRNNVELFEYQNNILHGKIAVCDSKWLTIGSYNINDISAYASVELNLDVKDPVFAMKVEKTLEHIILEECTSISKEHHASSKNVFRQFSRWFSYQVFRLLFFLFTFYFRQRH